MTESCSLVNDSEVAKPLVFSDVENAARMMSITAVEIHTLRGRRSTRLPTFAQVPVSWASTSSKRGIRGQKIQRPKATSSAGKSVKIVIIDAAIPIAPTGPKPRLLESSLRSSTNKLIITVVPEAKIGSKIPL